mmetsp:Transcript_169740/g.544759  ORF Transcript_169740/g.544759 Transcript_169740/m.544759 type:complete len:451 (+) Transcript_169740:57-1409(+)
MDAVSGNEHVRYCVGLGSSCHVASFLQSRPASLRRFALPFDWLLSSPEMISDCLDTGCSRLLDRSLLVSRSDGKSRKRGQHQTYRTEGRADIFNHHDPALNDDDFVYLHRCCDRLRCILADRSSLKLFLHIAVDVKASRSADSAGHAVHCLFAALSRNTSKFLLFVTVCVFDPEQAGSAELLYSEVDGTGNAVFAYRLHTRTRSVVPMESEECSSTMSADLADLSRVTLSQVSFDLAPAPPPLTHDSMHARVDARVPPWVDLDSLHYKCGSPCTANASRPQGLCPVLLNKLPTVVASGAVLCRLSSNLDQIRVADVIMGLSTIRAKPDVMSYLLEPCIAKCLASNFGFHDLLEDASTCLFEVGVWAQCWVALGVIGLQHSEGSAEVLGCTPWTREGENALRIPWGPSRAAWKVARRAVAVPGPVPSADDELVAEVLCYHLRCAGWEWVLL